jgi:hypothetical protein
MRSSTGQLSFHVLGVNTQLSISTMCVLRPTSGAKLQAARLKCERGERPRSLVTCSDRQALLRSRTRYNASCVSGHFIRAISTPLASSPSGVKRSSHKQCSSGARAATRNTRSCSASAPPLTPRHPLPATSGASPTRPPRAGTPSMQRSSSRQKVPPGPSPRRKGSSSMSGSTSVANFSVDRRRGTATTLLAHSRRRIRCFVLCRAESATGSDNRSGDLEAVPNA